MSITRLQIEGLAELREELRRLPSELAAEATAIVNSQAEAAAADIRAAYPVWTGALRDGVGLSHGLGGQYGASATVVNRAKHARIFEVGTQTRVTKKTGANRGTMPAGNVFIPRMIAHRATMYRRLADMMRAHGLTVTFNG